MIVIVGVGWVLEPKGDEIVVPSFSTNQTIRQIAASLLKRPVAPVAILGPDLRPPFQPGSFDLVITTPQYRVPRRANVVNNTLTLHSVTPQRLEGSGLHWPPWASWSDAGLPNRAIFAAATALKSPLVSAPYNS